VRCLQRDLSGAQLKTGSDRIEISGGEDPTQQPITCRDNGREHARARVSVRRVAISNPDQFDPSLAFDGCAELRSVIREDARVQADIDAALAPASGSAVLLAQTRDPAPHQPSFVERSLGPPFPI
jgi:hypothetical protein